MLNQQNYTIKKGTKPVMILIGILEILAFLGSIFMGIVLAYLGLIFQMLGAAFTRSNEAFLGIDIERGIGETIGGMIGIACLILGVIVVVIGIVMVVSGAKSFKSVKDADTFYKRKGGIMGFGIFYIVVAIAGVILLFLGSSETTELAIPIVACSVIAIIGIVKIIFASGVKQISPTQILKDKADAIRKIENQ